MPRPLIDFVMSVLTEGQKKKRKRKKENRERNKGKRKRREKTLNFGTKLPAGSRYFCMQI